MSDHQIHTAFVTGGSGFIGRNLIAMLRTRGVQVRALARSADAMEQIAAMGAQPVRGDLADMQALCKGMTDCDTVFHLAAYAQLWGGYEKAYAANVTGTENVLAAAQNVGVSRVVYMSTEAVLLGGGPVVNADEKCPRAQHPLGFYALTKGLGEARVIQHAHAHGLTTVVVRPRMVWGKGDTNALAGFMQAVQSGSFAWISGGRHLTSTCHVANVCEGTILAAERGETGEIYFLSDGPPVEFRQFVTAMLNTQNVVPGNRSIPRWLAHTLGGLSEWIWSTFHLKGQPPLTRAIVHLIGETVTINDAKARRELGYTGTISREAGLQAMKISTDK